MNQLAPRSLAAIALLLLGLPAAGAAQGWSERFSAMEARHIGPAGMSGRVAAVAVAGPDRTTIFVGAATGGVWRSTDGGVSWSPIFDDQPVQSIGAVAVHPSNPDVVWVGTGEGNPRNSMGVGYGVFRSLDGGETWTSLGLEGTERIHRILLDPTDPDVAFVAAMGPAWSDSPERGVYRTVDGGATWDQVLKGDERTGAADLIMDPTNPNKLFAAMWEFRRWPWFFESGGQGSGLFVTHDGGDTWDRVTEEQGMPEGVLGRIGLAVAHSDPDVVYALVEAERSELLRSDDGGRTFRTISDRAGVANRPFYYADLRVDPSNENRLYSLESSIEVSEDQGRTFRTVVPSQLIHGDVQELWIDKGDPRFMIIGNDGGIAITHDRGEHWRFVENLPLAQFYHVSVDNAVPFNIYGGLQDNGSWYGPSTVWENRGIMNGHWRRVGGGDGFSVFNDPSDDRFGYSMSQQGSLSHFDKSTGERRSIQPAHPDGERLRFNWNAGLALDPLDPSVLYLGSQYLHRSRDQGRSWEIISPDLTTNDPQKQRQDRSGGLTLDATGAENHTTIVAVAPSPVSSGLIWVGTDDGNVQLTRDDGATWTSVGEGLSSSPDSTWVPQVEASRHAEGTAYAVQDDHRRGNWGTYVYRTEDYGETWEALPTEGVFGFAHVIREDPIEPRLLFLGTEFGLYVSLDRGQTWNRWSEGVPAVPVRDLVVHSRDHDLVIGTHGRGVLVLDDIRPLRALAQDPSRVDAPLWVSDPPPAYSHSTAEAIGYRSVGHAMFFGDRRPPGALLSYWVGDAEGGTATVEIRAADGALVSEHEQDVAQGLNRFAWDMRMDGDSATAAGTEGLGVLPGRYEVTVRLAQTEDRAPLEVREDPREERSPEDRARRLASQIKVQRWRAVGSGAREQLEDARTSLDRILEDVEGEAPALVEQGQAVRDAVQGALEELFTGPTCQGICGGRPVFSPVGRAARVLGSSTAAPGPNDALLVAQAESAIREIVTRVNALFAEDVAAYRQALVQAGVVGLGIPDPLGVS